MPYLVARTSGTALQIPEFSRTGRIVRTISSPAFPLLTSQQRTHNWNTHAQIIQEVTTYLTLLKQRDKITQLKNLKE
jgi:hypothetical protein